MPIARFLFFSSKHRLRQPLNLIQRFDLSKRTQSCSYTKSTRQSHGKQVGDFITPAETKASRSWSNYIIPAGALLGFAGIAALVHYNDERRAVAKGQGKNRDSNVVTGPIIGGPFTLVDTENCLVTEKNFLGNWVLLYFGYTSSPDVGPEQVQIISKAIDALESKQNKILPVFVTIDPQRDTPAHLRAYLKEFNSRIVGLTGPAAAIRQMAQEYRVYFKKVEEEGDDYLVESSHHMYLINPRMEVVRCFGVEYAAEELAEEISKEIKKAST